MEQNPALLMLVISKLLYHLMQGLEDKQYHTVRRKLIIFEQSYPLQCKYHEVLL